MTADTSYKIVIDENIPFGYEAFSPFGKVVLMPGREITAESVRDADFLIVRSITKIDSELLSGSRVKFVGTATIGTDHVDIRYLEEAGIKFASAAGCNSNSVREYLLTALFHLCVKNGIKIGGLTIGIFGAGNIGSKVWKAAEGLGMYVLVSDPPLFRKTGDERYLSLKDVSKCDVLTVHVPLTHSGEDKTYRLFNEKKIESLKENTILFNTSRGGVVDETALLRVSGKKRIFKVFDVWENEPDVNTEFADICDFATPHIAGYSYEGKANGTKMIYDQLCGFLGVEPFWSPLLPSVEVPVVKIKSGASSEEMLLQFATASYDLIADDVRMREALKSASPAKEFDRLRKVYPVRREFSNYIVDGDKSVKEFFEKIEKAGFWFGGKINRNN